MNIGSGKLSLKKEGIIIESMLCFRVPSTRFFSTLYPQPIVLSAGTSYTLPVTFRPLEKAVYNDAIEVTASVGFLICQLNV